MGTFIINPKGSSSITCSLNEDPTVDYQVIVSSIDMNEKKRLEVLYAAGEFGGSVRKTRSGLVPIKFRLVVFGATQAVAMANFRAVALAVTNREGGTVQYKPLGLGGSVLDTYYHYLQSPPPSIARRGHFDERSISKLTRVSGGGGDYGVECLVELMTQAWATSDIDSPTNVVNEAIDGCDDSTRDNYVAVLSSEIKGDIAFPIIKEHPPSPQTWDTMYVHHKVLEAGSSLNLDIIEAEDMSVQTGIWTNVPDVVPANSSNLRFMRIFSPVGGKLFIPINSSITLIHLGKVVPIVFCRYTGSGEWSVRIGIQGGMGTTDVVWSDWEAVQSATSSYWKPVVISEIDYPYYPIPGYITDDSDTTIAEYLSADTHIVLEVRWDSGTAIFEVDCIALLRVSGGDWIARFEPGVGAVGYLTNCVIDTYGETVQTVTMSTEGYDTVVYTYGMPLSELILHKGFDHRIRFWEEESLGVYCPDTPTVVINLIYGTVYPFEE